MLFLGPNERLILSHRADNRMIFARGALAAARFLVGKPAGLLFDAGRDRRSVSEARVESHGLARRLGLFDATMLVMGGIIGSGIFVTPAEVARHVDTPLLIVGVWVLGGIVALAASFVYAELAARRPDVGGQYAYLRDAYGPMPAFLYGWALLLVIQSGGMAAVAITFARYFGNLVQLPVADSAVAVAVLALLTLINCLGVRSGSNVQSVLMVLKIVAIAVLVGAGMWFAPAAAARAAGSKPRIDLDCRGDRRSDDSGDVLLRRVADVELRRRRNAQSAARSRTRLAVRRRRRDPALLLGRACLRARTRARRSRRRPRRRRPTSCGLRWATEARASSRSESRSRLSAFSARAC